MVSPQWRAWVAENLVRGAEPEVVLDELLRAGVPQSAARELVEDHRDSDVLPCARALAHRVAALESMLRLRPAHRQVLPKQGTSIERIPLPSVDTFLQRYWATGVPVVFSDLVPRWPAFGRWSLDDLAGRVGESTIRVCTGRNAAKHPDVDWRALEQPMRVAEFVDALRASDANDLYVTTNNAAFTSSGLRGLLDDINLPEPYFGEVDPRFLGLWIGMRTRTPMHHDHANGVLCQVVGRKRVVMVPPDCLEMLETARGVYNRRNEDEELESLPGRIELILEAGEALFIPTGWWHRVEAEGVSMSVSIRKFAWPNAFGWYRPGTALAGRDVPASTS